MTLSVDSAELAASSGDDRLIVTDGAVIVLDGATAHDPAMPSAGEYVDKLASELVRAINEPSPLPDVLERSIAKTAAALRLTPGLAPSSTVALVRIEPDAVESVILGDSSTIFGQRNGEVVAYTDDRLSRLNLPLADVYRRFLSEGQGFSGRHRKVLADLQVAERAHRNQPDGYWIAEADPSAAKHAIHVRYPRDDLSWIVIATDGAVDLMPALEVDWPEVAQMTTRELHELLHRIDAWEAETDPDGQALPRAKRHDDKTIAVIRL
ncbi:PP2C family serine/threonine-protein phosphatase [Nocardia salmonicida]|uniref:PP2C family serine/threonine-protein phosphatase n=1 Tax=Nocardia salmonicida TaxID=53431 RepID=UPI0007A5445B|nr:PP2C family serine/threonine-protein phosphatase [Nocardia salmonicida]